MRREDDSNWPMPNRDGKQELEVVLGSEHISFSTAKIGSLIAVQNSADPEGEVSAHLRASYFLRSGPGLEMFRVFADFLALQSNQASNNPSTDNIKANTIHRQNGQGW